VATIHTVILAHAGIQWVLALRSATGAKVTPSYPQAGIQWVSACFRAPKKPYNQGGAFWIPAFAGMTVGVDVFWISAFAGMTVGVDVFWISAFAGMTVGG